MKTRATRMKTELCAVASGSSVNFHRRLTDPLSDVGSDLRGAKGTDRFFSMTKRGLLFLGPPCIFLFLGKCTSYFV